MLFKNSAEGAGVLTHGRAFSGPCREWVYSSGFQNGKQRLLYPAVLVLPGIELVFS